VKTISFFPYRAEVAVDQPVLLETPRVLIPGYRATVNGRPVAVQPSAEKLVTIALPPGRNTVELTYEGTTRLKLALAGSAAAWLALIAAGIREVWSRRKSPAGPDGLVDARAPS
jgi:hypothetical protein